MAFAALGATPVLDARVSLPRFGTWSAELRLNTDELPTGQQRLTLGGVAFMGTVTRATPYKANSFVRMVGGAAGLPHILPPRAYHSSVLMVPLQDIAREAGETLSASCDSSVTNIHLGQWTRLGCSGGASLNMLLGDVPGAVWRFMPGGELWVGRESWPTSDSVVELTDYQALADRVRFFSHAPGVLPGTALLGRRVSYVEHHVSEERIYADVWFEGS